MAIKRDGWGMCLNDQLGDCVIAWMVHHILCMSANTTTPLVIDDSVVQATYSAITGYNPSKVQPDGSNPTDNGTNMQDALNYWRDTGIGGHKILGWVAFDWTNQRELDAAKYIFGGAGFGVNLPQTAMDDFEAGNDWTNTHDQNIIGGHAIYGPGDDANDDKFVTWGKEINAVPEWTQAYVEEAYVVISDQWVNIMGASPSGFNLSALLADAKAIATS